MAHLLIWGDTREILAGGGVRTDGDKYIRRFSPDDDELYFDLARDPGEKTSLARESPDRVRLLQAQAEAGMAASPFRYAVEVAGSGRFALTIETRGWLEGVEATGLGPQERWRLGGNGRRLELALAPRPGAPRQIGFTVRPVGAPVTLAGTRDGRPLRPADVAVGESSVRPEVFPFRLPDVESETEADRGLNLFAAPRGTASGVRVWLALPAGRSLEELDPEARERLKALGYVGPG